jgi:hypothetical protein
MVLDADNVDERWKAMFEIPRLIIDGGGGIRQGCMAVGRT